jgi:hypothetical protein
LWFRKPVFEITSPLQRNAGIPRLPSRGLSRALIPRIKVQVINPWHVPEYR